MDNDKRKGILYLSAATFFLALATALIRLAGALPSNQKAFFRGFVILIASTASIIRHRKEIHIEKQMIIPLLFRGLAGALSVICNFYAIDHLNLADANMLNKLSPFFAVLFSWLFLGERMDRRGAGALCLAFIGSLFIVKPTGHNLQLFPALIGALGGVIGGFAFTCVRAANKANAHKELIVFSFAIMSCATTLPTTITSYVPMSLKQWIIIICCGLLSTIGHFLNTRAYALAAAKDISVTDYLQVVFSAFFGLIIFGQLPDVLSIIGYVIIIGTGVYVFLHEKMNTAEHKGSNIS